MTVLSFGKDIPHMHDMNDRPRVLARRALHTSATVPRTLCLPPRKIIFELNKHDRISTPLHSINTPNHPRRLEAFDLPLQKNN